MFTIRGKLLIYALEIVAAVILVLSVPPWEQHWIQFGLLLLALIAILLALALGRSIAAALDGLVVATRRIGGGDYATPVPVETGDELGLLALAIDHMRVLLREKNRDLEERIVQRSHELRMLREITGAVHSSLDFQDIFKAVVEGTRALVEFEQATIARRVTETEFRLFATSVAGGDLRSGQPIDLSMARFREAVRGKEAVAFDVEMRTSGEDTFGMSAIRREVILPLRSGHRVLGTLNLGSRRTDAFSASEVLVLEPITAILAVALLRVESEERQKELSDLKDEFVSKVSHELRTPLTSILGGVDNVLEGITGPLEAKPREVLLRVRENGERLLRLINELLDLSRIESGHEELRLVRFRLDLLVRETFDTLRPLAERHGVALEAAAEALEIVADRDKVARVLVNLVQNAIKFTAPGGRVQVRAEHGGESVELRVHDTGIGIPAGELDRIFDKFHQVKASRGAGGTGLGLPISRQLVEMHGGRLVAESAPGSGSTFVLTLPTSPPTGSSRLPWHES